MPPSAHHPRELSAGPLGEGPILVPESWFRLSRWGKATGKLNPYMNKFSSDIGRMLSRRNVELTDRQIHFALKVWTSASKKGFNPEIDRYPGT